ILLRSAPSRPPPSRRLQIAVISDRLYYKWTPIGIRNGGIVKSKREITNDAIEAFLRAIVENKPFSMALDSATAPSLRFSDAWLANWSAM
ncbi:MAG: hypothetical protein ACK5AZ_26800, partial [Bryobacteraceae bacterium]